MHPPAEVYRTRTVPRIQPSPRHQRPEASRLSASPSTPEYHSSGAAAAGPHSHLLFNFTYNANISLRHTYSAALDDRVMLQPSRLPLSALNDAPPDDLPVRHRRNHRPPAGAVATTATNSAATSNAPLLCSGVSTNSDSNDAHNNNTNVEQALSDNLTAQPTNPQPRLYRPGSLSPDVLRVLMSEARCDAAVAVETRQPLILRQTSQSFTDMTLPLIPNSARTIGSGTPKKDLCRTGSIAALKNGRRALSSLSSTTPSPPPPPSPSNLMAGGHGSTTSSIPSTLVGNASVSINNHRTMSAASAPSSAVDEMDQYPRYQPPQRHPRQLYQQQHRPVNSRSPAALDVAAGSRSGYGGGMSPVSNSRSRNNGAIHFGGRHRLVSAPRLHSETLLSAHRSGSSHVVRHQHSDTLMSPPFHGNNSFDSEDN